MLFATLTAIGFITLRTLKEKQTIFFQRLYREAPAPLGILPPNKFPQLKPVDIGFFGKLVSNKEIKVTLFDMALFKAPGNDGFHALFFSISSGVLLRERFAIGLRRFSMKTLLSRI